MAIMYSFELDKALYVDDVRKFYKSELGSEYSWSTVVTTGVISERQIYKKLLDLENDSVFIARGGEERDFLNTKVSLTEYYKEELESLIISNESLYVTFRSDGFEVGDELSSAIYGVSNSLIEKAINEVKRWYENFSFLEVDRPLDIHWEAWYSSELFNTPNSSQYRSGNVFTNYEGYHALKSGNNVDFFAPFILGALIKTIVPGVPRAKPLLKILDSRTGDVLSTHRLDRDSASLIKKATRSKMYRIEVNEFVWFSLKVIGPSLSLVIFSDEALSIAEYSNVNITILPLLRNEILGEK